MSEYSDFKEFLAGHGGFTSWDEMVSELGEAKAKHLYAEYRDERRQDQLF